MHLEFSIIFLILYNSATTVATIIQKLFNHWFGSHRKYDHLWPAIAFIYCFLLIPSILILVAITKKLIYRNKIRICNNCLIRFLNCNRKYRNIVISKTYFAEELSAYRASGIVKCRLQRSAECVRVCWYPFGLLAKWV